MDGMHEVLGAVPFEFVSSRMVGFVHGGTIATNVTEMMALHKIFSRIRVN